MADEISREEKLAAGLKKLKKFQNQRSKVKAVSEKKSPSHKKYTENLPENKSDEVPSQAEFQVPSNISCDLELTETISSSCSDPNVDLIDTKQAKLPPKDNSTLQKANSDLLLGNVKEFSSTESLRQISLQVNGLMTETNAFINGTEQNESLDLKSQSLEKRNQELALLVNNLRQSNDQLQFQLQELKGKYKRLNQSFDVERKDLLEKSHKEQVALKDQLQVHIQTIGILVAEKTELQSSLALSQQTAKQKAGEVEELQGRLKGSRHRASELERELNALTGANQQLEKGNKDISREIERIKLDLHVSSKSCEEYKLANSELTEKLNRKINDFQALEKELGDCQSILSATEAKVQQLSQAECGDNQFQLEEVYQQKLELEQRISHNKDSISKLILEREQMSEKYQQYISQLSQQVTSLRDEVKQHCSEKDLLSKEKNMLNEQVEAFKLQNTHEDKDDLSEMKLQISILKNQNKELNQKLQSELATKDSLSNQLLSQEAMIVDLEKAVTRLKEEQIDHNRLAETMQSDKVAASRAVCQNRELKKQLEELQTGFVGLSNDKLKLVEEVDSQKHIIKELGERLSQQEKELSELQEQLTLREEELQKLHISSSKGIYQQNQIADRMRHYEAQGQLNEMLQKELNQAQEQIRTLTVQNSDLRMALATQADITSSDERGDKDSSKRNDLVESLSTSVRQLEMERDQMMKQLEEQKSNRNQLEEQLKQREVDFYGDSSEENDVVSKAEYAMIKSAMSQLEERFKQTMNRIAELTDERQQLEHLVTQLQGETETIGDYIALYQIQRGLMRKRASEKDDYIAQLARDREELKEKLTQLQNLVMRLLEERKQYESHGVTLTDNLDIVNFPCMYGERSSPSPEPIEERNGEPNLDDGSISSDVELAKMPQNTAKKIIDLLSEIESTNLVEKPVLDNFHPCPVCSGRLLTV